MSENITNLNIANVDLNTLEEIEPTQVYLTIPAEYFCIYHKILVLMADFGKTLIDDCSSVCQDKNRNILSCWTMFQSACAAHGLGDTKRADFFINYIKEQLDSIYRGTLKEQHHSTVPIAISADGKLMALASCDTDTKFYVDAETGRLYRQKLGLEDDDTSYRIENNNLIAER